MNELIIKYLDYIVEHQMRNDAGIRTVRDKLQGNPGIWAVAVMRYAQTMQTGDASYLAFRNKWAWDNEKVDKVLASDEGKLMKSRIVEVADFFKGLDGMKDYKLSTGSLRRDVDTQAGYFKGNWSVKKLALELMAALSKELEKGKYPDPPTEDSAKKLYAFLTSVQLQAVCKTAQDGSKVCTATPTSAAPGLSDHGHLSAVDFVIYKNGKDFLGADFGQVPLWRAKENGSPSFEDRLKQAINKLNDKVGSKVFVGPLPRPDEPWHYTYTPLEKASDKKT